MSDGVFRSYVGQCDFNVGALFAHDGYVLMLASLCDKFGIDYPIDYVFGSVACVMSGGRATPAVLDRDNVKAIFESYAKIGIGCRLTFSNYELTEADLEDDDSNFLLSELNQGKNNGVILSSDLLADYVRATYPNLQVVSSLVKPTVENTLGQESADYYNDLCKRYDIVVVNNMFAQDDALLEGLERPEQIEFILNHRCRPNCPLSKSHYTTQTKAARAATTGNFLVQRRLENQLTQINSECQRLRHENPLENSLISASRAQELVQRGFKHFKIEGRDYALPALAHDIGIWIFEPDGVYLSIAQALLNQPL